MHTRFKFIPVILILFSLPLLSAISLSNASPQGGLPIRPTAVPTALPINNAKGATIVLDLSSNYAGYWTQVQWQDPTTETWFNVDGWHGNADNEGDVAWWVAPEDLGNGPFRWQVYQSEGDSSPEMTSSSFNLPIGQTLTILINEE